MMSVLIISSLENLRIWFLRNSSTANDQADDDDDDHDLLSSPPALKRRRLPITILPLIKTALIIRIIMLLLMAISCRIIPDHNASGIMQFDIRFPQTNTTTSRTADGAEEHCFALRGTYCDSNYANKNDGGDEDVWSSSWCAVVPSSQSQANYLQSTVYPFLLTPLTRWDSARFLRLALYGRRRGGKWQKHQEVCRNDSKSNNKDDKQQQQQQQQQCRNADADTDDDNDPLLYVEMEQSHAFFPFFPVLVQWMTSFLLLRILPRSLLPSTCEGCLVLGTFVTNTICFVLATIALYDMTFHLILAQQQYRKDTNDDGQISTKQAHVWSQRSTLAFLINPANVFFGTAYSESLFAALAFVGGAILARMSCTSKRGRWFSSSAPIAVLTLTTFCWWLATWTRSNGTLYYGYLVLLGIGQSLRSRRSIFTFSGTLLLTVVGAIVLMASSVGWHNYNGYQLHCNPSEQSNTAAATDDEVQVPDWCFSSSAYSFNLYGYVQRKYWNVGLLRYYQWKQIPNFLLATPIILLAVSAAYVWIQCSWERFVLYQKQQDTTKKNVIYQVCSWAIYSLQEFASQTFLPQQKNLLPAEPKKREAKTATTTTTNTPSTDGNTCPLKTKSLTEDNDIDIDDDILYGPLLLGHYAVLGAACLLGVLIAHVQISTRLICSTCPALYWHMAACITRHKVKGGLVVAYCFLYMFLGVILHSNWLPWT